MSEHYLHYVRSSQPTRKHMARLPARNTGRPKVFTVRNERPQPWIIIRYCDILTVMKRDFAASSNSRLRIKDQLCISTYISLESDALANICCCYSRNNMKTTLQDGVEVEQ